MHIPAYTPTTQSRIPACMHNTRTNTHTHTHTHTHAHTHTTHTHNTHTHTTHTHNTHTHTYSHYKVVVVSTGNIAIDTRTEVLDSRLLPASQNLTNYYAAGAIMVGDLQTTFFVGNGQISTLNGMAFENVRLSAGQPYVVFIILYSSEIVSYIDI